jgi:multiple sugar transport system permease protein
VKRLGLAAAAALAVAWSLAPFVSQVWNAGLLGYLKIFEARPFAAYMLNSALVGCGATALCLGLAAPAAYALARRRLPGGAGFLTVLLGVSLFPPTLLVVALKRLAQQARLLNSLWALVLVYAALNLPFAVWALRAFFSQVPEELEEAALMDGMTRPQLLRRVIMPLAAPAVATTAILVFIFCWNEFLLALSLISRDASRTVPVGIALLSGASAYEVPWDQISAAVVVTTLPVVAVVLLFQRRIVEGLTAGAVKG